METKLTLNLDKFVIEKARKYAISHKRSLSDIIESYLQSLTIPEESSTNEEIQISPYIKSMSTGVNIPIDIDIKATYSSYISEKHK